MELIKVYAKAMNRTALGIVNAYFKLHPTVTFKELKEKFPDTFKFLRPSMTVMI